MAQLYKRDKLVDSELVIAINDGSKRRYDYYGCGR